MTPTTLSYSNHQNILLNSRLWLSYGSKYLVVERPHHLTREECENIYQTRRLQISYAGKKIDLKLHQAGPTIHKFWLHGKLDDQGWCTNRDFIEDGELYESAMLEVIMRITTRTLESTLATDQQGTPQLGLKSHGDVIMTKYEDGFAVDRSFGTAFWEVEGKDRGNCTKDVFSVVAHSVGQLYQPRLRRPNFNDHAFLLHEDSINNQTQTTTASAFILYHRIKGGLVDCQLKKYLQDRPTFQTHIPGIYVAYRILSKVHETETPGNVTMGTFKAIPTTTMNLINLRAQLAYITVANGQQVVESLAVLEEQLCQVRLEILRTQINSLVGSNNQLSLRGLFPPGTLIVARGSAVYGESSKTRPT